MTKANEIEKPTQVLIPKEFEMEYHEISEDWRHRDNLTWQLPSVIVIVGGALVAAAYGIEIEPNYLHIIRAMLLLFGTSLSFCLTYALKQNLQYQVGSSIALKILVSGAEYAILRQEKNLQRRVLNPKQLGLSKGQISARIKGELRGSFFLLLLCIFITSTLFILFVLEILATFLMYLTLM